MADLDKLVADLGSLTVLEAAELSRMLEAKWGVSAAPTPMVVSDVAEPVTAVPEQTSFDLILCSAGEKRIDVIRVVRALTGLGLKELKEVVESIPKTIKENLSRAEVDDFANKLREVGATVEIK